MNVFKVGDTVRVNSKDGVGNTLAFEGRVLVVDDKGCRVEAPFGVSIYVENKDLTAV